jgi:hypothetical protein
MERSELDHIVIAAPSLDAGVAWVEERLGARPVPGGQHVAMGTHNALLRLGSRCYLEVIAIDPAGRAPARPRWFALDEPGMQARLAAGPALVTWVVRTPSLASACARVPDLGEIMPMTRNAFRWKISVPDDGSLAWGGILPTAIQWEEGDDGLVHHPCDALPAAERLRAGVAAAVASGRRARHERHRRAVPGVEDRRAGGPEVGPEDPRGRDPLAARRGDARVSPRVRRCAT